MILLKSIYILFNLLIYTYNFNQNNKNYFIRINLLFKFKIFLSYAS